jgi:hypothetical protein
MNVNGTYSVPYLQFDHLPIYFKSERAKLDANGNLMLSLEFIVHYSLHEATLAYTCISDYNQFKKVVLGV